MFCLALPLTEQAAGLASIFCKNTAEFPPHPPSAVFLQGRTKFLAANSLIVAKKKKEPKLSSRLR